MLNGTLMKVDENKEIVKHYLESNITQRVSKFKEVAMIRYLPKIDGFLVYCRHPSGKNHQLIFVPGCDFSSQPMIIQDYEDESLKIFADIKNTDGSA